MPCRQTLGGIKRQKPTRRRMFFTEVDYISAGQTSLQVQCEFYIGRVLFSILPEIGGTIFTPDNLQDVQGFLVPRLFMTFSVCRPNRGKGRLIRTSLRFQNSSEKRYSDWGPVHTNSFPNENGAVLPRFQKDLRPHLSQFFVSFSPVHTTTPYPFWKRCYTLSTHV